MAYRLAPAFLLLTLTLAGCAGSPPADLERRIAWFHEHANAGRYAEIRREYTPIHTDWEKYMGRRAELGRMVRTKMAAYGEVNGYYRLISVSQNTEFERAVAVERFDFRLDETGTRLAAYQYLVGKRVWCPMITFAYSNCEYEDAPATVAAR